jgi:hypothetical protein
MARFLHTNVENREFWTQWREQHNHSLRSLEAICFRLANQWFGCDLAEEVETEVRLLAPAVEQWMQRFNRSPLEGMFRPNKNGVWLHIALLESARDQLIVLRHALAPMRMPAVGAPGQDVTREGKPKEYWPSQRYAKYLFYVASRVSYHAKTLIPTLWRGAKWWLAAKNLGRAFWTFLATSFFLDFGM